jgi:hypothetical protein
MWCGGRDLVTPSVTFRDRGFLNNARSVSGGRTSNTIQKCIEGLSEVFHTECSGSNIDVTFPGALLLCYVCNGGYACCMRDGQAGLWAQHGRPV